MIDWKVFWERVLFIIVMVLTCALSFWFIAACTSTKPLERGPLSTLVLRPRAGHVGFLTNKRCVEFDNNTCIAWDQKLFNMDDFETRRMLRELKFTCNVQGQRFVPCEKSRGLCQLRIEKGGWFKPDKVVVNKYYSMVDDYEFLIGANTYCASADSLVGQEMFN